MVTKSILLYAVDPVQTKRDNHNVGCVPQSIKSHTNAISLVTCEKKRTETAE